MASLVAKDKGTTQTGWDVRHNHTLSAAQYRNDTHAYALVQGLRAWENYAAAHRKEFDSLIGEDYVLGPMWKDWGLGMRGLLNGLTGNLDCGTVDAFILDTLAENGIDTSTL